MILLLPWVVCAPAYGQVSSLKESPGNDEDEIRASLLRFSKQYLEVVPADGFFYHMTMEEAYDWQDEFIELLKPTLGGVIKGSSLRLTFVEGCNNEMICLDH